MHELIRNFSFPWYIYVGIGVFFTLVVVKPSFRKESDSLLARMLGLKPKHKPPDDNS